MKQPIDFNGHKEHRPQENQRMMKKTERQNPVGMFMKLSYN